jgi:hypothetical protein
LIHASDAFDSATKEIGLWFNESELADYEPIAWVSAAVFKRKVHQLTEALGHGRQLDVAVEPNEVGNLHHAQSSEGA